MSIEGKVALVTGGSGGLGRVHGAVLARMGCQVALTGNRNLEKAQDAAEEIAKEYDVKALGIKMDVSDADGVGTGVAKVASELGPIEILVNNAAYGIVRATTIVKMEKSDWDKDVSVNLTGAFNTIKAVMPRGTSLGTVAKTTAISQTGPQVMKVFCPLRM